VRTSYQGGVPLSPPLTEEEKVRLVQEEDERKEFTQILAGRPISMSTIQLREPAALLACAKCGIHNSPIFSSLRCGFCNSSVFLWSCPCIVKVEPSPWPPPKEVMRFEPVADPEAPAENVPNPIPPKTVSNATPPAPQAQRKSTRISRILPPLRSYSPRICYMPPARKGMKFHFANCNKRPTGGLYAGIEFALGMGMKGESCCFG
jgi:hypothetical protein